MIQGGEYEELRRQSAADLVSLERTAKVTANNEALEEAFEALRALGYVEKELKKVRPTLSEETLSTDAYIRKALQLMLKA